MLLSGGSNENIADFDDTEQATGEMEQFAQDDEVVTACDAVEVDKIDVQIEETVPNNDNLSSNSNSQVSGSRSRKCSVYEDGFAHLNEHNDANPFDHISIPQNIVAVSEDPFDDSDGVALQSSSKDSIPVRELHALTLTHSLTVTHSLTLTHSLLLNSLLLTHPLI